MKRILITGAAGYIGSRLARFLAEKPEVEHVAGVDVRVPLSLPDKFAFAEHDVRDSMESILKEHAIDTVVHAAFVLTPIHDTALMEDININGTRSVLESCRAAGISQILYLSSATAYGFHPDNQCPLTEESPLRGNEDFTYSKSKRIIEGIVGDFADRNPGITVTVVRPCNVVGPGFDNPVSHHFEGWIVVLPKDVKPLQFVHEDDLIEIIYRLLDKKASGAFNVTADGTVKPGEMVRMLGNIPVFLPYRLLNFLNRTAWFLRLRFLTEFPSPAMDMLRYSWDVSCDKLIATIGYRCRYTSRQAFEDYARSFRQNPKR